MFHLTAVLKILKDIKLFQVCDVSIMEFTYEIKNQKLKKMVEKKAKEMHMSIDELIWGYINRGLMADNLNEDVFEEVHSQKFLMEVNDALGVD